MSNAYLIMDMSPGLLMTDIKLDTYEINDVLVYAHTFPQESFSTGVLGLNVLSLFYVNLLFSKGKHFK